MSAGAAGGRVDTIPSNLLGDGYGNGGPGTSSGGAGQLTDIVTIIINIDDTAGPSDGVAAGSSSNSSSSGSSSTSVGNGGGGGWTSNGSGRCSNAGMSSNARDSNNDSTIICDSSESNSNSQLISKQMIDA